MKRNRSFNWLAPCVLLFVATLGPAPFSFAEELPLQRAQDEQQVEGVELFRMQSKLLTEFWGRPMFIEAGVVTPPTEANPPEALPVCYSIHGFGGSHRSAWRSGPGLRKAMADDNYPPMLYVFLNAQFPLGHHEFADSVNNGPWGQALTEEFIPALEEKYHAAGKPAGRLLTGHSSGGWSSLWLQVNYPEFFGGTWSTAPDSVDFRDFTGINVYEYENAYTDPEGNTIQLVRRGEDWVASIQDFVKREMQQSDYGGQFASFDAVFSPRAEDGRPMKMFDRETGKINRDVADAWKKYDIGIIVRENWDTLGPKLKDKVHIYMGTLDTFRLEGALKLFKKDLEELGSDAEILLVDGRNHGSLFQPHEKYWPDGMLSHIHHRMWEQWQKYK